MFYIKKEKETKKLDKMREKDLAMLNPLFCDNSIDMSINVKVYML